MKLKLDENLPASAAPRIRALGFDVDTVLDEGLGGRSDADVWLAAQVERRFFVTQDMDFSDARRFAPGTHAGLCSYAFPMRNNGASQITSSVGSPSPMQSHGEVAS